MGGVFVIVLYITSLSTNEIGRYLTYLKYPDYYPPEWKSSARGTLTLYAIVDDDNFLGPCKGLYVFLIVTSYTLTLYWLTARLRKRPKAFLSFARYENLSHGYGILTVHKSKDLLVHGLP